LHIFHGYFTHRKGAFLGSPGARNRSVVRKGRRFDCASTTGLIAGLTIRLPQTTIPPTFTTPRAREVLLGGAHSYAAKRSSDSERLEVI
jgi:hypothetical protein